MHPRRLHQRHVRRFYPAARAESALTRDVVRVARPAGVSVEAEVGTIGTTAEYGAEIENPHLADPAACEAMGETGIDALAVAIGNAHGVYVAEPKLDFDLLAEIRRRTEVPLVLQGGSGIPVDQVQKAIGMGVAKMNVGTAIHVAFKEGMEEGLAENPGSHDIMKILSGCQERVRDVLRQYVEITVSAGRSMCHRQRLHQLPSVGATQPKELTAVVRDSQARSPHLLRIGRAKDVGLEVGGNAGAGRFLLV